MTLFGLRIYAISSNPEVHTKLRGKIPARLDSKMWSTDYTIKDGIEGIGGSTIPVTIVDVRFNDSADRTTVIDQINALSEFKPDCEIGSYIKIHSCGHEDGLSCGPNETLWEKS